MNSNIDKPSALRSFAPALVVSLVLVVFSAAAFGQASPDPGTPLNPADPQYIFFFDENGNSFVNGQVQPAFGLSPIGGVLYVLPGPVAPGVVEIKGTADEPTTAPFGYSDRIIFDNRNIPGTNIIQGLMTFQSWIDDNDPVIDLADVQFAGPLSNFVAFETGVEGNNSFIWRAGQAIYFGVSDGQIPEPSSLVMSGIGLFALLHIALRRSRRKGTRSTPG